MTQKPSLIDHALVADGLLFATRRDRCLYLRTTSSEKPDWLNEHKGSWQRIVLQDAALLAPPAESDIKVGAAPAGPNSQTPSCDVRNDSDDEGDTVLVDTLPGDCSPPCQPTQLPTPVKANAANGSTKAELLPSTKTVMRETKGLKTKSTPRGVTGRKRSRRGSRQLKKQKLRAGISNAGRKLSPERMRIVLDSLAECPILSNAARKAGIHCKTLAYWIKRSTAGDAGYDIEWQGETWKFHEHCEAAMDEAHDKILAAALDLAMGGFVYKTDPFLLDLGCQGADAYLKDENGNLVIETFRNPNGKMIRWILERYRPEKFGKNRKIDVPLKGGVLVVGAASPKKLKNTTATAASIRARDWKATSRMIRKAES